MRPEEAYKWKYYAALRAHRESVHALRAMRLKGERPSASLLQQYHSTRASLGEARFELLWPCAAAHTENVGRSLSEHRAAIRRTYLAAVTEFGDATAILNLALKRHTEPTETELQRRDDAAVVLIAARNELFRAPFLLNRERLGAVADAVDRRADLVQHREQ